MADLTSGRSTEKIADDLEHFVREQAKLYGDVISYVPSSGVTVAPQSGQQQESSESTTESTMQKQKLTVPGEVVVTHHGFAELKDRLVPYENEEWTKVTELPVFHTLIDGCMKCRLGESRTKLVFGVGDPKADVMVIGEAPGEDEDIKGEPFIGRAGGLLDKMLAAINMPRESVFIANILKSRPPHNRDPKPDEVEACEPYLWKQILMIQPKMILCVGRVAGMNLMKLKTGTLGQMRGNVYDFYGIKVLVTYHPAALLRNPAWKHDAWEDLQKFRRIYDSMSAA